MLVHNEWTREHGDRHAPSAASCPPQPGDLVVVGQNAPEHQPYAETIAAAGLTGIEYAGTLHPLAENKESTTSAYFGIDLDDIAGYDPDLGRSGLRNRGLAAQVLSELVEPVPLQAGGFLLSRA